MSMKVYELIQELSQYKADTEVRFHVNAEMDIDVKAEFDRENEDDVQEVTVKAEIDEDFDFDDIADYENKYKWLNPNITINLTY